LDDLGQWRVANLNGQMDMIAHAAERVDLVAESGGSFLKEEVEAGVVSLAEEDLLPAVSPEHHVIDTAGNMNSGFPRHIS